MTVLLAATSAIAGPVAPASAEPTDPPLAVSLDSITPATLPTRGTVTVTGEITNRSTSTWSDLNAYLFVSSAPMTTSEELAEATRTDVSVEVGERVTDEGLYDEVDDLAPGASTPFRISVPRRELPVSGAGVYWLGVHVLGTNEEGRVEGADGRARTFIASVPRRAPTVSLALVVPFRARVTRATDGRLGNVARWQRRLVPEGRLGRLLGLSGTAGDAPLTWVVDPAVVDSVRSLAEGNPPFDLSPTEEAPATDPATGSATPSPTPETASSEGDGEGDGGDASYQAQVAREWLAEFGRQGQQHTLMTLPYGDLDLAALLRHGFGETHDLARQLGVATFESLGLQAGQVVAPPDGRLPDEVVPLLDPETPVLLDQAAVGTRASVVQLGTGHRVALSHASVRIGGPGPEAPHGALALRQRILAEAAVRALTGDPDQPLVMAMPSLWDPGPRWQSSEFFAGLDVPWIRAVDLPFAMADAGPEPRAEPLRYPSAQRRLELPGANLLATQELTSAGSVLAALLARNETADEEIARAAMLASSAQVRDRPQQAVLATRRIAGRIRDQLRKVSVESSSLVTLSSETGSFSVTVVNGLDEPVTVGLDVVTKAGGPEIRPPDLVTLGAGQRASVRLSVRDAGTGVHAVELVPTTEDGRTLGRPTRIKVRSSQVGLVIWLIIGTGAAVFVAAIALRVVRRVRARRSSRPDQEPAG